jgi:hypothetical protein
MISLSGPPIAFINFNDQFVLGGPDVDLDMDYVMSIIAPDASHKIRFLHVSRGCWKEFPEWVPLRKRFQGLKELVISFLIGASLLPYIHEC